MNARLTADPRTRTAGWVAALDRGETPRLKRTHGDDAVCPTYDALVVEMYGPGWAS